MHFLFPPKICHSTRTYDLLLLLSVTTFTTLMTVVDDPDDLDIPLKSPVSTPLPDNDVILRLQRNKRGALASKTVTSSSAAGSLQTRTAHHDDSVMMIGTS